MPTVFIFKSECDVSNAVFSTQKNAEEWISRHGLTGVLTGYDLDDPAFDRHVNTGKLPVYFRMALKRGVKTSWVIENYADGSTHYHYYYGLGGESPGYHEAFERWHRERGYP